MAIQSHAGQPTLYNSSMVDKVEEYINTTGREATYLPTIEGFAEYIGVDADTIGNWATAVNDKKELIHPEFFGAIKRLKDRQKNQLMNDGMYGGKEVNSTMAIFLLKANHGLIETDRHEVGGLNGQPIQYQIITGTGFIPSGVVIDATPESDTLAGQSPVQDSHLA